MAAHDAWALVCRLFAGGTPVLRATLSPRVAAALSVLGKAVKPTVVDQSFVPCPHCQQHRAQVCGDGRGGRMCRCPDCGPVAVEASDGAALALDEEWLRQKLRLALGIESRDGVATRRRPPLARAAGPRSDARAAKPALLDRVRVASDDIRVITPRPRTTRGSPFGAGVEWLALEERFTFYGGGIALIGATAPSAQPAVADPATPVNGPFSADFKWVTLPDISSTPIRFTDGQARVFEALWSFKGEATTAEWIMQRGLEQRETERPVQDQVERQGQAGTCGAARGLWRARGHAATRRVVFDAMRGVILTPDIGKRGDLHGMNSIPEAPRLARLQEPVLFNFWSA